jgi:hypothetical protein
MREAEWVERMASELKGQQWPNQGGLSLKTALKVA